MRLAKFLLMMVVLLVFSFNVTKAEGVKSKESELSYQYKKEIKEMMLLPVYLKFEDKNLRGEATVNITVKDNGKIILSGVRGENKSLNSYIESKVNEINAWTSKEYAGKTFNYKVIIK